MNIPPSALPVMEVNPAYLLEAAHDGRLLIMSLNGPKAPYPIFRIRLTPSAGLTSPGQTPGSSPGK